MTQSQGGYPETHPDPEVTIGVDLAVGDSVSQQTYIVATGTFNAERVPHYRMFLSVKEAVEYGRSIGAKEVVGLEITTKRVHQ